LRHLSFPKSVPPEASDEFFRITLSVLFSLRQQWSAAIPPSLLPVLAQPLMLQGPPVLQLTLQLPEQLLPTPYGSDSPYPTFVTTFLTIFKREFVCKTASDKPVWGFEKVQRLQLFQKPMLLKEIGNQVC
jgi:hypothetical protein